jgi:hypothetical protein
MESKKINQLATELAPDLSDLTIIGDPTTGISKKITLSQMASLFTGTVEEYANFAAFPLVGVADTIYIAKDTNVIYRWDSTAYVVLSPNIIASLVFNDANGFDGTISLVGSVATLTITTALTSGSVPFIGASGALTQDNSNLFFDDTNNRLGIATATPTTALDVFGSGIIGRLNATSTNNSFIGFSSNGTNKWSAGNVQSDHRFRIFSEANSAELITILQTGEFGIGIANPTTKFHIDGAASALIANLDANVSIAKSLSFRSDNSARINLEVSGTESGSNVGADFFLRTFTDAGSLLETPFTIVRSTGVTTIKSLTLTNVLSVANGGTGSATQNFVDLTSVQTAAGAKTFSAITTISNATASTSTTTGALVVTGGLGIGGALYGTSATFSSSVTAGGELSTTSGLLSISGNAASGPPTGGVGIRHTNNRLLIYGGTTDITFQKNSNSGPNLTILESGAATFTGEVNVTSGLLSISGSGGTPPTSGVGLRFVSNRLLIYGGSTDITFQKNSNAGPNLTILESGAATFSSSIAATTATLSTAYNGGSVGQLHMTSSGTEGGTITFEKTSGTAQKYKFGLGVTSLFIYNETAANQPFTLTSVGDVGIGRTAPGGKLDVAGTIRTTNTTDPTYHGTFANPDGNVHISSVGGGAMLLNISGTERMRLFTSGNIRFSSQVYGNTVASPRTLFIQSDGELGGVSSVRESKINIQEINLNWLMQLKPVSFNYRKKDEEGKYTDEHYTELFYGLIAEETELVNKEICTYNDDKLIGIEYSKLITPMLKMIQELKAEIDILKAK